MNDSTNTPRGFLTESELVFYTGRIQSAAQIRVLQKWGVRHIVNADGDPRVTWDAVNGSEKPKVGPNFAALREKKPGAQPNFAALAKAR